MNPPMVICHACQRPISSTPQHYRGEPVHSHFPHCLPDTHSVSDEGGVVESQDPDGSEPGQSGRDLAFPTAD